MRRFLVISLIILAISLTATLILTAGGNLTLPWYAIAGGGAGSTDGERVALTGTIGQAAAGQSDDGSRFEVASGFVAGVAGQETTWALYLPLVELR